jgi:hypothetical protein
VFAAVLNIGRTLGATFSHGRHFELRLGKKVRIKCNEDDKIGDIKKLIAAQVRPTSVAVVQLLFPPCSCYTSAVLYGQLDMSSIG